MQELMDRSLNKEPHPSIGSFDANLTVRENDGYQYKLNLYRNIRALLLSTQLRLTYLLYLLSSHPWFYSC